MIEAGTTISHYRIIRSLGSGGMADVYEVEDTRLGRRLALKVLPPELTRQADLVARFEKEIRAAALLDHPNIVTLFEFGHEGPYYYYTMQLLTGGDLRSRMREPMTLTEVMRIIRAIASAFEHAHKRGFVHRDVKPENIMFDEHNTPVLTDFGIAKAMGSQTQMTKTGMSVGTPRYMSPEAAHGKTVDGRADLYALGCILYELLAGAPPYDAPETMAVIFKHVTAEIPALPDNFTSLQPLLERLMAKEPDERIPDAATLLAEIDRLMPRDWTGEVAKIAPGQTPGSQVSSSEAITVPVDHTALTQPVDHAAAAAVPPSDTAVRESGARRGLGPALIVTLALLIATAAAVWFLLIRQNQPTPAPQPDTRPTPSAAPSLAPPPPTPAPTPERQAATPTPAPATPTPPPSKAPTPPPIDPATILLNDASAAERAGNLDAAKSLYRRIVQAHGTSRAAELAATALKRIEDAQAAERRRQAAAAAERQRQEAEAAAARQLQDAQRLLEQALATERGGDLSLAREQFSDLVSRYPELAPAKTARQRIKAIDAELKRREKPAKEKDETPVIGF